MSTGQTTDWMSLFPALAELEDETALRLAEISQEVRLPARQAVFHVGDSCDNFLLVLDGRVRVQMVSESGREIVLYRVDTGETCVLTTACLLGHSAYSAEGITETDVHAIVVPAQAFRDLLGQSQVLRDFVFQSYGERLTNLMVLVEEVAFGRVDIRLARLLCERTAQEGTLATTHQELAVELGSAREVISRQLKDFERRGLVKLSRGQIAIADGAALEALAAT